MRCGKRGHIARECPQRPTQAHDRKGKADEKIGFVGSGHVWTLTDSGEHDDGQIFGQTQGSLTGQAIIDSGASDNIIGVNVLQELMDKYETLGFACEEIHVDRVNCKQFTFGNSESNTALGRVYLPLGVFGHEVEAEVHLVEGNTPFLLSAKFLADMNATVNFRTGTAIFRRLSAKHFQLERTSGNHLVIPILAFAGRAEVFEPLRVIQPDSRVQEICDQPCVRFADPVTDAPEEGSSSEQETS